MKNVSFRQLRVFVEVAKHLSFVRAAEALHLTPPAVTMQVKELESALELPLFDRQGRKVALTTSGEYFLVYAKRLLGDAERSGRRDGAAAQARGRRADGGLGQHCQVLCAAAAGALQRRAPGRRGAPARQRQPRATRRDDERGEVDLAIMGRPPKELDTRAEAFAAHPHVFIAPAGHSILTETEHPTLSQLAREPLIVREAASGTRALLDRFLREHKTEAHITMEMTSNETIKQAVMAGMGLSFLSLHTIGLELTHGLLKIVPIEHTPGDPHLEHRAPALQAAVTGGGGVSLLHAGRGRRISGGAGQALDAGRRSSQASGTGLIQALRVRRG